MKKLVRILCSGLLIAVSLCGCKKDTKTIANPYEIPQITEENIDIDIPLTYVDGTSEKVAVVGIDAVNSPGCENLNSDSALLIDATTGEVLFQKNPHKQQYPASITKVLTTLVTLKKADTSGVRTVGDEIVIKEDNVIMCDFRKGDVISYDVALHGAMMRSGNDAAAVMALFAANSISDFAELMNEEAKNLGATKSHFVNPHGLYDDNHYTTAYDLYLIFNEAIKYSKFIDVLSCKAYNSKLQRITASGTYDIICKYENTNRYVMGTLPTPKGITVIGGKAGYTQVAKRSYIMLAEANGHNYIVITMRCETADQMYQDLTYLLNKIPISKSYADND